MVLGKKSLILNLLSLFLLIIAGAISVSGQFTHTLSGVTINSPAQNQNISGNFTINITATKTFNLTNVTFHARMGNGTVVLIGTNSSSSLNGSIASGITFRFDTSLASFGNGGFGIFNISANLSELNGTTYNTTVENGSRNVSIANTPPTITLNAPSNNAFASSQKKFNFSVVSIVYPVIEACNLTIDGPAVNGTIAITNGSSPATSTIVSIATQSEGAHLWTFVCRDSSQQNASIANNTYTEDNTNPQANITIADENDNDLSSTKEVNFGSLVKVSCVPGDTTAGLVTANQTMSVLFPGLTNFQNLTLLENSVTLIRAEISSDEAAQIGDYSIRCFTWDKAGNFNTTELNFTTKEVIEQGTSAAAIPGFESPVGKIKVSEGVVNDGGRLSSEASSRLIALGGAIIFDIKGEKHKIEVKSANEKSVTLIISSDPVEVTIDAGKTKNVDLNRDGESDIEINYHQFFAKKYADITFKLTSASAEEAPASEEKTEPSTPAQETTEEYASPKGGLTIIFAVIVIILIIGYALIKGKRK